METKDPEMGLFRFFAKSVYGVNWDKKVGCEKHTNCLQKAREMIMEMFKHCQVTHEVEEAHFRNLIAEIKSMTCYANQRKELLNYLYTKPKSKEVFPIALYYKIVDDFNIPENVLLSGVEGEIPLWMLQMNVMVGWLLQFFGTDSAYDDVKKEVCDGFKDLIPVEHEKIYKEFIMIQAFRQKPCFFKSPTRQRPNPMKQTTVSTSGQLGTVMTKQIMENEEPRFTESQLNDYSDFLVPFMPGLIKSTTTDEKQVLVLDGGEYLFNYPHLGKVGVEDDRKFTQPKTTQPERSDVFLCNLKTARVAKAFYKTLYPDNEKVSKHLNHYKKTTPEQHVIRSFRAVNNVPEAMILVDEAFKAIKYALNHRLKNETSKSMLLKKTLDREIENWGMTEKRSNNFLTVSEFSRLLEKFDLDKNQFTVVPDMIYLVNSAIAVQDITKPLTFINSKGEWVMDTVEVVLHIFRSIVTGVNLNDIDKIVAKYKLAFMYRAQDSDVSKKSHIDKQLQDFKNQEVSTSGSKVDFFFKNNQIDDIISLQLLNEKLAKLGLVELQYSDEFSSIRKWEAELYMIVACMCFFYDKEIVAELRAMNLEAEQPMQLMQGIFRRVPLPDKEQFKENMIKLLTVWDRLEFVEILSEPSHPASKKAIATVNHVEVIYPGYSHSDVQSIEDERFGIMGRFKDDKKILITNLQVEKEGQSKIILDDVDCARENVPENALDSLSSYLSFYPDKKIYLRSIYYGTYQTPMFVAEEVYEVIPLLARQQGIGIEKIADALERFEECWSVGSGNAPTIFYLAQVNEAFGFLSLRTDLLTTVPDIGQLQALNEHLTRNSNIIELTDLSGNPLVTPAFAIYNFFRECVLGLNWKTNKCKKHPDCLQQCKQKILDVMKKWSNVPLAEGLIWMEDVEEEIKVLKEENCYMKLQSKHDDYFFRNYKFDENAPVTAYTSITSMFDLPKCRTVMIEYPAYLMRAWCLAGWVFQFFGVEDDQVLQERKETVLHGIAYLIPEKKREKLKRVFEIETWKPQFFKYDGEKDPQGNEDKIKSVAEKRALRNLAIQQKKKNQKNGNPPIVIQTTEKKNSMTKLGEFFASKVDRRLLELSADLTDWVFPIKGERYQSSYETLRNRESDSAHAIKYFPIGSNKYRLAHDVGVLTGAEWVDNKKSLSNLSEFIRLTGVHEIVMRSFIWGFRANVMNRNDIRFFSDEVYEVIEIAMDMQKISKEKHADTLAACRRRSATGNDSFHSTITLQQFEKYLDYFDIDKSTITIIPDMIQGRTGYYAINDFSLPVTTLDSDGCEVMTIEESILHTFRKLVFGVDWKLAAETKGVETVRNFKHKLIMAMRYHCDNYQDCFVKGSYVEEMIEKLRDHEVFKETVIVDMETIMNRFECQSEISVRDFNRICDMYSLPRLPSSLGYQKIPMVFARAFLGTAWACVFYDIEEELEGICVNDVAQVKNIIFSTLSTRVSPEIVEIYNSSIEHLWPYWVTGEFTDEVVVNEVFELKTETTNEREENAQDQEMTPTNLEDTIISKGPSESNKKSKKKKKKRSPEPTVVSEVVETVKNWCEDSPASSESAKSPSSATATTEAPCETDSEISESPSYGQESPVINYSPSMEDSSAAQDEFKICSTAPERQGPEEVPDSEGLQVPQLTPEESELDKYKKKCSELELALEAAQTKADRYERRAKRTDEAEKANREMMEKVARVEKLEAELERANAENEKLEARWAKWKDRDGKKLEETRKKHEKTITDMQQTIKDMQAESELVTQELKKYTKHLKKEQKELKETKENLGEQVAKCLHMEQEMNDMKSGYDRMKKQWLDDRTDMDIQIKNSQWEAAREKGEAEKKVIAAESNARRLAFELENKKRELEEAKRNGHNYMDKANFNELIKLRRTRLYLLEKIESLQRGIDKANGEPPQSHEENEKDAARYCERLEEITLNFERSLEMIALRDRITGLKNLTESDEVKALADAESAILEKTVTVQVGILELNIMRAQNGENLLNCYPLPPYPTLSEKFEKAVQEEANEPVLNEETECGYCYKIRRDSEPQMTCPNEKCPIKYHSVCIKPVIAKNPICPYCKCDFLDPEEFPPPSTSS